MKNETTYQIKKIFTMDGMDFEVLRDGKVILSGTYIGESDSELIVSAIRHAKERGL